jgi:hypothetical protein
MDLLVDIVDSDSKKKKKKKKERDKYNDKD